MNASPNEPGNNIPPPDKSTVVLLLRDIGSTTWRMFVPTIGLMLAGLLLDQKLHTAPLLLLIGLLVGSGVSALLVRSQLKKVKK